MALFHFFIQKTSENGVQPNQKVLHLRHTNIWIAINTSTLTAERCCCKKKQLGRNGCCEHWSDVSEGKLSTWQAMQKVIALVTVPNMHGVRWYTQKLTGGFQVLAGKAWWTQPQPFLSSASWILCYDSISQIKGKTLRSSYITGHWMSTHCHCCLTKITS